MKPLSLIKKLAPTLLLSLAISYPAFSFTDLAGEIDAIDNHLGDNKWTIVEIWKSDCHSCREHMPSMVEFDGKLKNVRILGVSLDGQAGLAEANDFLDDFNIKFPTILSNPIEVNAWMEQNLEESLIGTPTFILFNEKGELIAAQAGIVPVNSLENFIMENSAD